MSEKRKPDVTIVAKIRGKKATRLELFRARMWPRMFRENEGNRFRARVNGRWIDGTFTVSEVMRQMRRLVVKRINAMSK